MTCHIFRYRLRRCQFQNTFIPVNNVLSTTTTNRLCKCIVLAGYDHSSNVVYLITGNKSKVQYLGKTSQNLNKRFNWHSFCFRNPTSCSFCKIWNTDFSKDYYKDSSYTVNIIEKLRGQDVQIGIPWILQLNQFERLERLIWCMN